MELFSVLRSQAEEKYQRERQRSAEAKGSVDRTRGLPYVDFREITAPGVPKGWDEV
jgi:hypothetical protein